MRLISSHVSLIFIFVVCDRTGCISLSLLRAALSSTLVMQNSAGSSGWSVQRGFVFDVPANEFQAPPTQKHAPCLNFCPDLNLRRTSVRMAQNVLACRILEGFSSSFVWSFKFKWSSAILSNTSKCFMDRTVYYISRTWMLPNLSLECNLSRRLLYRNQMLGLI